MNSVMLLDASTLILGARTLGAEDDTLLMRCLIDASRSPA
jgi:hypothetical protein